MKVKDAIIMTLQDIEYYQTCSANTLEKGLGTIEMLQGSIRAIMKRHPDISRIDLQDKSFFTLPNKDNIPLPEYRLLTKGRTWYEEHFGAKPNCKAFKNLVDLYKDIWASNEVRIPQPLTEQRFKNYLKSLHFPNMISGNAWHIPMHKLTKYAFDGVFKRGRIGGFDGGVPARRRKEYIFRLFS